VKRLLVGIGLLLAGLSDCVTPVIPLPPPDPESYAVALSADQDRVTISGAAATGSLIYMLNRNTGSGTITTAQGGLFKTEPMSARHGDRLDIWTARGIDEAASDTVCATVDLSALKLTRCQ
jgi:hypothetical protein